MADNLKPFPSANRSCGNTVLHQNLVQQGPLLRVSRNSELLLPHRLWLLLLKLGLAVGNRHRRPARGSKTSENTKGGSTGDEAAHKSTPERHRHRDSQCEGDEDAAREEHQRPGPPDALRRNAPLTVSGVNTRTLGTRGRWREGGRPLRTLPGGT